MGKCMNVKGYIAVLSEYGKFPASKAKCGTSTLARVFKIFSPSSPVRASKKGVSTRRRGAALPEFGARTWLPNESLFDRPWGSNMQEKKSTERLVGSSRFD
jgi:hypothetical protein